MKRLHDEIMDELFSLSAQLSPENISSDGEASATQIRLRRQRIMRQWRALEQELGKKVSEDDTWAWFQQKEKKCA